MKIIAVILLLVGLVLGVVGAAYFLSEDARRCQEYNAAAEEKLKAATAAAGTIRGAALMEEARLEIDSAERICRQAKQTQQMAWLTGSGAFASLVVSVVLLVIPRKRRTE